MTDSQVNVHVEDMKRVELITVSGRIDSTNAAQFDSALKEVLARKQNIVLDMNAVDYISSAGLRAIVAALREAKDQRGDLRLANPSNRVSDVLALAGLDELFQVFDSTTSAVGSF